MPTLLLREIATGSDWSVMAEIETSGAGPNVTKMRIYNFTSTWKTFTIDLPNSAPFNVGVDAGSDGYAHSFQWPGSALAFRFGGFGGGGDWELRLFDGDTEVGTSTVSVS